MQNALNCIHKSKIGANLHLVEKSHNGIHSFWIHFRGEYLMLRVMGNLGLKMKNKSEDPFVRAVE